MSDLQPRGEITPRELAKGRNLKIGAVSAPVVLGGGTAALFLVLVFLFGSTPPMAATIFFLGLMFSILGFVFGLALSGYFMYRHSTWSRGLRDRMAARGIRAEEIDWFHKELKPAERLALKQIESRDELLADTYREMLASRLTATRIIQTSKKELHAMLRRQNKLRYNKSESSRKFLTELEKDTAKIESINLEAKQMLAEVEARLQMIDVAALRGSSMADSELALKKLSARTAELPLALESARMAEDIRRELDAETDNEGTAERQESN